MARYRNAIVDAIKQIDTDSSDNWSYDEEIKAQILEEQKVYIWIRLYLKEEMTQISSGDDVIIQWIPSGEKLKTKFVCFGKQGLEKDHIGEVVNFNPDDDKKILCLMVDERIINTSDEIPFIRTLFKSGIHYEYQLMKREELKFILEKNELVLDYYDCDF
jgi:hypothetical protein